MSLATLLQLNALSCLGFGALFVAFSAPVAGFRVAPPDGAVRVLGAALVVNGLHLVWAAGRYPPTWEVRYFARGRGFTSSGPKPY